MLLDSTAFSKDSFAVLEKVNDMDLDEKRKGGKKERKFRKEEGEDEQKKRGRKKKKWSMRK